MFSCVGNIEVTGGEERLCSFNQDRNQCAFSVNAPIQIGSGSILLTKLFEIILYIIDYHLSSISHEASPSSVALINPISTQSGSVLEHLFTLGFQSGFTATCTHEHWRVLLSLSCMHFTASSIPIDYNSN